MRSWWRKLDPPEGGGGAYKTTAEAECESEFRLESLEPRLLLSADPISAELARLVQDDAQANDVAAIIQEIDNVAETHAAEQSESGRDRLDVVWPKGWHTASDEVEATDVQKVVTSVERGRIDLHSVVADLVAKVIKLHDASQAGAAPVDLVVGIKANSYTHQEVNQAAVDESSGVESNYAAAETVELHDASQAGAAPVDLVVGIKANSYIYQEFNQTTVDESSGVESDHTVSQKLLNHVLDEVIQSFSASPLAGWLDNLSIQVADLEGDLVAELRGDTLFIDINAAGNGWFIDPVLLASLTQVTDVHASVETGSVVAEHQTNYALSLANTLLDSESHPSVGKDEASPIVTADDEDAYTMPSANSHSAGDTEGRAEVPALGTSNITQDNELLGVGNTTYNLSGTSGSNGSVSHESDDLLLQVSDLVSEALGIADSGSGNSDSYLVISNLAAVLRLQQNNRSSRSELNRETIKTGEVGTSDAAQVSLNIESDTLPSTDRGNDSEARAPPVIQQVTNNSEDQASDAALQGAAVVSAPLDEAVVSASLDESVVSASLDEIPNPAPSDASLPGAEPVADAMPRAPPADDADMPRAPPTDDAMPRAPPVDADTAEYLLFDGAAVTSTDNTNTITSQQLYLLFQQALRLWSETTLSTEQLDWLNALTVQISDLSGGILGKAQGDTIYIDTDAAGYGWFVDPTPGDSSECGVALTAYRLAAGAGSDAFGRVDLLTVLFHEIGHVLGFSHEDGPAVMAEVL